MSKRSTPAWRDQYGLLWPEQPTPMQVEMHYVKHGGYFKRLDGEKIGKGLFHHFKAFKSILWQEIVWHRWNILELECFLQFRIIGELGPASCVAGETKIYDPILGTHTAIQDLCEQNKAPHVMTLFGPSSASVPFLKGIDNLYEVTLENGIRFSATANHLMLTPEHGYVTVSSLQKGSCLLVSDAFHPQSTSESFRLAHVSNGLRLMKTVPDFQCDYPVCSYSYGEPLRMDQGTSQDASPLSADALKRKGRTFSDEDDSEHTPSRSHLYHRSVHRSIAGCVPLCGKSEIFGFRHAFSGKLLHDACLFQSFLQFRSMTPSQRSFSTPVPYCERTLPIGQSHHESDYVGSFSSAKNKARSIAVSSVKWVRVDKFYDIQVPDFHHYFAEGVIHHNSGKTHSMATNMLADYYCFPRCTTILISSTTRESLENRVWGEMKKYHRLAKDRFPELSGNLIEGKQRIITDSRQSTAEGRDFRNGVCGVPCKKGQNYQGLSEYAGIKNTRVRLGADELHFLPADFVSAISNLNKNPDFKCIGLGNPKDITDALGKLCEPSAEKGGWDGGCDQEPGTKTWPIRFERGICIQLVGSDSPNLDGKLGIPLISQTEIDEDIRFYGKDSLQFTMMDEGRMPRGQASKRVITRQMCLKFGATEDPVWKDDKQTKIAFLDAAYGGVGGDRTVFGELWFGKGLEGKQLLWLKGTEVVPVSALKDEMPEDQIANFVKEQCTDRGIPADHFFFDSTGRGSLMSAFCRLWGTGVVGVEFGGKASERPVSDAIDVLCCDYYFNFVSELWFSSRLIIEGGQFRGMTEDAMQEGSMREWGKVAGNKTQVEPKEKMKIKTSRSPDIYDSLCAGIEGARRLGFTIAKLAAVDGLRYNDEWKKDLRERVASSKRLQYRT